MKLEAQAKLDELDDELSARIKQLEEALRARVSVRIEIAMDSRRLVFAKHKGDWCFLVSRPFDDNEVPLLSCSRQQRAVIANSGYIEQLFDSAENQVAAMAEERKNAIAKLNGLLAIQPPPPPSIQIVSADRPENDDDPKTWHKLVRNNLPHVKQQVAFDAHEFVECNACAAQPGSPTLCGGCVANRHTITEFHRNKRARGE